MRRCVKLVRHDGDSRLNHASTRLDMHRSASSSLLRCGYGESSSACVGKICACAGKFVSDRDKVIVSRSVVGHVKVRHECGISDQIGINCERDSGGGVVGNDSQTVTTVADVSDSLDGTYLTLDGFSGTWAIWIDTDDSGTAEPAHGKDSSVEITSNRAVLAVRWFGCA